MKITKLEMKTGSDYEFDGSRAVAALKAAFIPFGSLAHPDALASALVAWAIRKDADLPALAAEAVRLLNDTSAEQLSEVTLGMYRAVIRTPTSGTMIEVTRSGGRLYVTVDFGANGSETRAGEILAAAPRDMHFDAWSGGTLLTAAAVREFLVGRARQYVDWLEGLPPGYYPKDEMDERLKLAREEMRWLTEQSVHA